MGAGAGSAGCAEVAVSSARAVPRRTSRRPWSRSWFVAIARIQIQNEPGPRGTNESRLANARSRTSWTRSCVSMTPRAPAGSRAASRRRNRGSNIRASSSRAAPVPDLARSTSDMVAPRSSCESGRSGGSRIANRDYSKGRSVADACA
jgi:hypothetical protein